MDELLRVTIEDVSRMVGALQEQIRARAIEGPPLWTVLNALKFRDEVGDYWTLGPCSQRWYRHDGRTWQPQDQGPGEWLEGPAAVCDTLLAADHRDNPASAKPTELPDNPPASATAPERLAAIVQRTAAAYQQGRISSADAAVLIGQYILLDRQGQAWTVGQRSGCWYVFREAAWCPEAGKPTPENLMTEPPVPAPCPTCGRTGVMTGAICPECQTPMALPLSGLDAASSARVTSFFTCGHGVLPEPLAAEWRGPAGFPEMSPPRSVLCPACGEANPATQAFCGQCGSPLTPVHPESCR